MEDVIYNHYTAKLSELDLQMISHVPAGGNWKNIPDSVPSKRLTQIRQSGGRTTYYGKLRWDKPSYTISTYFNRAGNGCYIHPTQNRLISIREGARLQSFRDDFIFYGSRSSQYKQVGNAAPPLMARVIAEMIGRHTHRRGMVDLFCGAGGMSEGFKLAGFEVVGAVDVEHNFFETYVKNNRGSNENGADFICGDIRNDATKTALVRATEGRKVGVIIGGPPCQGFSLAGWRNADDPRNQLFREFVHVVDEIRPEFFVMENVPGILTMREGEVISAIAESFSKLGYIVHEPLLLNAIHFGVPQRRKRVFIVGFLRDDKLKVPQPLFSETNPELPTPITVKDAIYGLPPLAAGGGADAMNYKLGTLSTYQLFLKGKTTFAEFYKSQLQTVN